MSLGKEITGKLLEESLVCNQWVSGLSNKPGLDIRREAQNIHVVTDALGTGLF